MRWPAGTLHRVTGQGLGKQVEMNKSTKAHKLDIVQPPSPFLNTCDFRQVHGMRA